MSYAGHRAGIICSGVRSPARTRSLARSLTRGPNSNYVLRFSTLFRSVFICAGSFLFIPALLQNVPLYYRWSGASPLDCKTQLSLHQ